jgi:hypothetical protein
VWWRPDGRGPGRGYVVLDADQAASAGNLPAD